MRGLLLALTVGLLLVLAGPAAADMSSFGGQSAGQSAENMQSATSSATSTQYEPSNENISVRVLSPGDDGNVSQSNNSSAESGALNLNGTSQRLSQDQSGSGSSCCNAAQKALQDAAQWAGNEQSAYSTADSTQKHPSNDNISVRVLSPGKNGNVDQSNNSDAGSFAGNLNKTKQDTGQSQGGSDLKTPSRDGSSQGSPDLSSVRDPGSCGCGGGSKSIQAAGQKAFNYQNAESHANSTQVKPSNENISVRVLSPGDDGDVSQSNNSSAESFAGNANFTHQTIEQSQPGTGGCCREPVVLSKLPPCCDGHSTGIQAAGQDAFNKQDATSTADSWQFMPQNQNDSLRVKDGLFKKRPPKCGCEPSPPKQCGCEPYGTPRRDPYGGSAPSDPYGGSAPKDQPTLMPAPPDDSGGNVSQENNSYAKSKALNLNGLWQTLFQTPGREVVVI
jgi:hypothetical protein